MRSLCLLPVPGRSLAPRRSASLRLRSAPQAGPPPTRPASRSRRCSSSADEANTGTIRSPLLRCTPKAGLVAVRRIDPDEVKVLLGRARAHHHVPLGVVSKVSRATRRRSSRASRSIGGGPQHAAGLRSRRDGARCYAESVAVCCPRVSALCSCLAPMPLEARRRSRSCNSAAAFFFSSRQPAT